MKRQHFEKEFLTYNENRKQVWVTTKVKKLPAKIVTITKNLAELDFLKFIRISEESLSASSENYPNRPKVPITLMNQNTAVGISSIPIDLGTPTSCSCKPQILRLIGMQIFSNYLIAPKI